MLISLIVAIIPHVHQISKLVIYIYISNQHVIYLIFIENFKCIVAISVILKIVSI